jgi:DNA excision repair protein ERCC-3
MSYFPENALIVQSDRSVLLEVHSPKMDYAIDLPDADVLIQVSGKYGSRQEEAQRLGRILRPKLDARQARFYTLVSLRTCEEEFARHRQLFLTEQGYDYQIEILD